MTSIIMLLNCLFSLTVQSYGLRKCGVSEMFPMEGSEMFPMQMLKLPFQMLNTAIFNYISNFHAPKL
jgi:hypothetical protein